MSPDKLDRLREKVLGGTNPKLFVPLSDEYKSLGMTAAAIHVLEHCIETYPNFMSARVALGNLYMEKGCFIHAIEEFKSVTEAIADNILSHRKLAELYTIIGETENALLSYKTILSIDPSDEDAAAGIEKIINEVRLKEQSQQEAAADNPDIPVEAISETSDIGDEYELTEGIDIEDGEETVVIETEPSTAEFTPEE
ncbi:tetratricopeptide repeat protein, partial [Candidatus Magnetominusculus dajiuhuensis]|uniref:tetratricopeptide repeat protein n=1 Tax=Candidatus Magnetominusculus dajiuhuensis TaxID=3137712 RepID=UPI003B432A2C